MPCRIGITTNVESRRLYWKSACPSLSDWQILAGPLATKAQAQAEETRLAKKYNCDSAPGGDDPNNADAQWYVYGFNHEGCYQEG